MLKRRNLVAFFGIIVIILFFLGNFLRQQYVAPIIMYHSIDPKAERHNRLAVRPETFARQMNFLTQHNYSVLPLETLVEMIKSKKKLPKHAIAITFDDGYKDNYLYALPILKKYNLPATIFIIVNEVGRPQNDRLNWDEIKAMQDSGIFTIGSHTLGPDPLFKMKSEDELRSQIYDSKRILEEKLGRKVSLFSYPEGMFDAKIRQLVIGAGYSAAVATNPGKGYPSDDVFALKRLRISENTANMFVFAVETSGYYTFMKESKRKH